MVLAAIAAMIGLAAPASAQSVQRVKCESWNYQPASCPAYNVAEARLVEHKAGNCLQGRDWRYDQRGIYVFNGCRAVFEVRSYGAGGYPGAGYPGGGYQGNVIRCESRDYRNQRCPANTSGGVRLQRVIGSSPCREGQTWGWDRSGVWVSNGCRAEFVVNGGYIGGGNPGGGYGRTIECNSRNYQPARCSVNVGNGVDIVTVLGGECIRGRSWGWDRNSIWVNDGCRARFRVY